MIKLDFDTDFRQPDNTTVQDITEKIIHVYYPQMIFRLNRIEESIMQQNNANKAAEQAILVRVRQELNGMIAKEQAFLYPILITLQNENQKTNCSLFKLVKKHYQSLISCIQSMKFLLRADSTANHSKQSAMVALNELESSIIRLQQVKEKHLFAPFKDCNSNCKLNRDE